MRRGMSEMVQNKEPCGKPQTFTKKDIFAIKIAKRRALYGMMSYMSSGDDEFVNWKEITEQDNYKIKIQKYEI